jgi:hypothetical protein
MERFDVHVALEVCEIVIDSATSSLFSNPFEEKDRFGESPKPARERRALPGSRIGIESATV